MIDEPGTEDQGAQAGPKTHSRREVVVRGAQVAGFAVLAPGVLAEAASAAVDRHLTARRRVRAVAGGTLTVAQPGEPKTLDPHRSTLDVFRHSIRSAVFDSLTWVDPVNARGAAEARTVVDGLARTARPSPSSSGGVKWHDGSPSRRRTSRSRSSASRTRRSQASSRRRLRRCKSVDVVDDTTVRFNLSAPTPPLLANLLQVQIVGESSIGSIETQADRHRPVQVRRVRSGRPPDAGEEPRLLGQGRRSSTSSSSRTCRTRSPGWRSSAPGRCR